MDDPRDIETLPGDGPEVARAHQFTLILPDASFAQRYRIESRIGAGGAGEVYAAHDELSNTPVALKVLFPRGDDALQLERLRRELRIVRSLTHPGIVRTHDVGRCGGLLYIVMDLLEGETLAARLRRGALPVAEAIRIIDGILDVLACAHASGVTHRDVKPANVFLCGQRIVLLDFGLARQVEDLTLTNTGAFVGTPEYVAPEQVRGGHDIGPAADVYSAGIVLWELLSGAPPFAAENTPEALFAHVSGKLPSPRTALRHVPAWLRDLAAWMLEKDVGCRPSANDALTHLRGRRRRPWFGRGRAALRGSHASLAIAGVLAAAALAIALVPVRGGAENGALVLRSTLGVPVRRVVAERRIAQALPLAARSMAPRDFLVLDDQWDSRGQRLWRLDAWTGALRPFEITWRVDWLQFASRAFPRHSERYKWLSIVRAPITLPNGKTEFAINVAHGRDYPNLVFTVDNDGEHELTLAHPGAIMSPLFATTRDGARLYVVPAENHDLGHVAEVLAIDAAMDRGSARGAVRNPGFATPGRYETGTAARWVTFLPEGRYPQEAVVRGDSLEVRADRGRRFALDLATGAPLDGPDAAVPRSTWLAHQGELLRLLDEPAATAMESATVAAAFEQFAARDGVAPSQASVALGRAAALWRRAGDLDRALGACRRARAIAPTNLGHARVMLDLLVRTSDWPAIRALASSLANTQMEFRRDFAIARLLLGHADELLRDDPDARRMDDSEGYGRFAIGAALLESARYRSAASVIDAMNPREIDGDLALVGAIGHLFSDPPDVDGARRLLAIVERDRGIGRHPPVLALRARLAALTGQPGPSADELARERDEQRAAAREDLVEWWFERWGERLRTGKRRNWRVSAPSRTWETSSGTGLYF